jgi:hypothetical protein
MLVLIGLRMGNEKTRDSIRHVSAKQTIQVVDTPARHFENVCSNSERGHAQTSLELETFKQNEITCSV